MVQKGFIAFGKPKKPTKNSPGLWPKGVLDNRFLVNGLKTPPTPPAGTSAEKMLSLVIPQSPPDPPGATFFDFFRRVFFRSISGSIFRAKIAKKVLKLMILASQNPSKIHPTASQNPCEKNVMILNICWLILDFLLLSPTLDFAAVANVF